MISFIVPAHNEQASLGCALEAIHKAARVVGQPYEIIVVDAYFAKGAQIVGKEKVERLSDQFMVPQKLTIKGTPYEIGLTIGHDGKGGASNDPTCVL